MVPAQPGQTAAVGTQPRAGVEITAGHQHPTVARVESESDDGVDGFTVGLTVIFPDTHQTVPMRVNLPVGIAQVFVRGDGLGRGICLLTIHPLIGKVGEIQAAPMDNTRSAAVLMDSGAGVERGGRAVPYAAVRAALDNDIPAALGRPLFHPVDLVSVECDLTQPDDGRNDEV